MADLDRLAPDLDGEVLVAGSPGFDAAWRPARGHEREVEPLAVVRCRSVRDVVRTLERTDGLHVVPRSGGHCFAGRSSTSGIVLDVSALDRVHVATDGRATVGGGARLGQVYAALHAEGRTIPGGCGPTVGVAGLTLGGGLGLLGRRHGLTCDRLVGAEIVLADGRVAICDEQQEADLFWALRGAGGGQFGVVTSLVFDTVPEPMLTRLELSWPADDAEALVDLWQQWAPDAPVEITADLTLVAEPGLDDRLRVFGAAVADARDTSAFLAPLTESLAPTTVDLREDLAFGDLKVSFAGLEEDSRTVWSSRSEYVDQLPACELHSLVEAFRASRPRGARRALNLTVLGGAYDAVAPDATAYAHRGRRLLLEQVSSGDLSWVDHSWEIVHRIGSGGVYPNFPDPALPQAEGAYHGDNLPRLRDVKARYDPDRRFRFPQSL